MMSFRMSVSHLICSITFLLAAAIQARWCKTTPDSPFWPTIAQWDALNHTVSGALRATTPLAAPCHNTFDGKTLFDNETCTILRENWANTTMHVQDPTSLFNPVFANGSCTMTADPSTACSLGFHPPYYIAAKTPEQIQHAINFARNHKLRVVIKNTGHDYNGKSTGAHALEIWTKNMKDMQYHNTLTMCGSNGGIEVVENTVTVGAGVQGGEVLNFLKGYGRVVVTGQCSTVGFAGGYISGGGHGPLVTHYGLAVDQLLSIKLVTANGSFITASPCEHPDLFWAVAGGGGSTFGVVTEVTVRTFPYGDTTTSAAVLEIETPPPHGNGEGVEKYWDALGRFYELLRGSMRKGVYSQLRHNINPNASTSVSSRSIFEVSPFIAYNMPLGRLRSEVQPYLDTLQALGIGYNITSREYPSYVEALESSYVVANGGSFIAGSRLIPTSADLGDVVDAVRVINERYGVQVHYFFLTPGVAGRRTQAVNAANPAFGGALMQVEMMVPVATNATAEVRREMVELVTSITEESIGRVGDGAYLNEANAGEPGWQQLFYGKNYRMLVRVKRQWDPENVFWARGAVGSEDLEEEAVSGRLCWVG